jgi:undecaprenyl diphosphate synthase
MKVRPLKHIAIILDGNRRWAKKRGLPAGAGHREAVKRLEPLIKHAVEKNITHLTLYTFSTENWKRSTVEVELLMSLFRELFSGSFIQRLKKEQVRICILGELHRFPEDIAESMRKAADETKTNTRITVNFALNYGGRAEIIRAVNTLLQQKKDQIDVATFSEYMYTAGQPDPDLMIRPGGEKRLSGFLLWQSEYTELYFTDVFMPDFTPDQLDFAIEEYEKRQRRFGS